VFADGFPGDATGELDGALAGSERRFEQTLSRADGEEITVEAFFRPHLVGGTVEGAVTLLADITERKRAELAFAAQAAELARSNAELEQFAYVASHDLKAPLRGIENLVTWIAEDLGHVDDTVAGHIALLRRRVRRLDNLLDDLLAYARAGRGEGEAALVDTGALVGEIAALLEPPPGLRVEAGASLPTILTPPGPLAQTLQNLIGNAIKHHDNSGHGHVLVRATREGDVPVFLVEDDGPGVPEAYRERVFGMFQTLRPRDEVEGSGMGLAIVRKLVERHGGTVQLGDREDGARGLAVRFTWPEAPDTGRAGAAQGEGS
jgi:signal transduction histidine kinase